MLKKLLRRNKTSIDSQDEQKEKSYEPSLWSNILNVIKEPFAGAWQQNRELAIDEGLGYPAVFACVSRISSDVSKLPLRLQKRDKDRIYKTTTGALNDLLKTPNDYQTQQQFLAAWESSIQSRGNAYIYKHKVNGKVESLHVLNPDLMTPLITDRGAVYYQIGDRGKRQNLNKLTDESIIEDIILPASEIIHDRINCFFHPLVGLSPLYAAALNVLLGKMAQNQQLAFFKNGATPSGILVFPGNLGEEKAKEIQTRWNNAHSGENKGGVAVVGDAVKYEPLSMSADDSKIIEQLKYGTEMICSVFHMPPYKVGFGPIPSVGIEALNQIYFSDCLQSRLLAIQNCLNKSFDLPRGESFRFDLDSLILMDSKTKMEVQTGLRRAGITKINEARTAFNYPPATGGDAIYLQQQDHSLEALARRDEGAFYPAPEPTELPVNEPIQQPDDALKSIDALAVISAFTKTIKGEPCKNN